MFVTIPELSSQLLTIHSYLKHNNKYIIETLIYKQFQFRLKQISDELQSYYNLFKTLKPAPPDYSSSSSTDSIKEEIKKFNKMKNDQNISNNNKIYPPTPFNDLKKNNYNIFDSNNLSIPKKVEPKEKFFPNEINDINKIDDNIPNVQDLNAPKEVEIKLSKGQRKRRNQRLRKEINKALGESIANHPENMRNDVYSDLQYQGFKPTPGYTPQ